MAPLETTFHLPLALTVQEVSNEMELDTARSATRF